MKKFILVGVFLTLSLSAFAQKTLIHAGSLIDIKTNRILSEQSNAIKGDKILSASAGYRLAGSEDKTVDLKNKTMMSRLMDMHVHIESQTSPTHLVDGFRDNESDVAYKALPYALITLIAGFTTVSDMGGSGVNIAFGTDPGVFPHGENLRKFLYRTEVGMPNLETIQAATFNSAQLLEVEDKLGTIEAGKIADIIAATGNPEEDFKVMKDVIFVMKEGRIYKQ
jgi:imidazolonepropionase-like amidohydrolase